MEVDLFGRGSIIMKKILLGMTLIVFLFMLLSAGITCLIIAKNMREIGTLYEGLMTFSFYSIGAFVGGIIGFTSMVLFVLGWVDE